MPAPPGSDNLTGRSNHRRNWLGQMVLQVEVTERVGHGGRPQPGRPTYVEVNRWRDATERDIRTLDWHARREARIAASSTEWHPPIHAD